MYLFINRFSYVKFSQEMTLQQRKRAEITEKVDARKVGREGRPHVHNPFSCRSTIRSNDHIILQNLHKNVRIGNFSNAYKLSSS